MVEVEISAVIDRPVEDIFAVLSNPENCPKWSSGSIEVKKTSAGPIGVGTTDRSVRKFLGQRIEGDNEFTEYEPNWRYATKTKSGPSRLKAGGPSSALKAARGSM